MSKSPPREYFYVIDVAEECFDVAEGDLGRAATLFRQILPDADEDLQQAMLEYLSRLASKQFKLIVRYRSHLDLDEPALRTELRARVVKILRENKNNPKSWPLDYEGEIKLGVVQHSFYFCVDEDNTIRLSVLAGSFDDILEAVISATEPGQMRVYIDYVDQVSFSD